jgi:uncharacterized protein (DUF4213/DUF364 family)
MPWELYDLLVDRARSAARVRRVVLGLNWSVTEVDGAGLCFSPLAPPRTLAFPGTLAGRRADELAPWIRSFDACEATVGCAVVNARINAAGNECLAKATAPANDAPPHLRVFADLTARVAGADIVVIGKYPGLDVLWRDRPHVCLERRDLPGTLPDSAAEYLLPRADYVFLTASAIPNKTLPRLLALSRGAIVVLLGPGVPWLAEWAEFGVHVLAGVAVRDQDKLFQVAAEGGGTRIFDEAVEYRTLALR